MPVIIFVAICPSHDAYYLEGREGRRARKKGMKEGRKKGRILREGVKEGGKKGW